MACAHASSACVQSDSIKGLAQSIARPEYNRLLIAETALRRAVPVLIIAFLLTICIGAFVQVSDQARQKRTAVSRDVVALADLLAERMDHIGTARSDSASLENTTNDLQSALPDLIPSWASAAGGHILVAGSQQQLLAHVSLDNSSAKSGPDLNILSALHLATTAENQSGLLELTLSNGAHALAARSAIRSIAGQVIILQEQHDSLWKSDATLTVTLFATTGFVVLILGFAFHWQSTRAREGDIINDAVRSRIDTALNRGRCGLWDWDLSRGKIFWSQSMFTLLGLDSRNDLMTFGEVNALVDPNDIDLFDIAQQLVSRKLSHIDHEFRMRHAGGHWIWLRVRCELANGSKDDVHLIGIAVDITEQKNLAEKTVEADQRLRDAIEAIPEAFVLWDAEDRLVLCNSYFQRLHKLPEDTVLPGTPYEIISEIGEMPEARSRLRQTSSLAPGARTFEAQLEDGSWLNISERRTKDGGYVSVGTDISQIKQHEQKLVDLARKYEAEKNRAEEANQTKSKFLANMSHELRTPLNAIIGFSEIMGSEMFGTLGSGKYQEYCQDILTSGRYLLEVINDILDMSKIEAGRMKLDFETLDLEQTLAESLRVVSGRAEAKNLSLNADIVGNLMVTADRRALKQIAINLLSNAVKFTPDGGKIIVRSRALTNSVVLMIADTGIGITPQSLMKLGRPFEQVESQLTKTYHGSGLGLAIAKSLARLHGGSMRLRSKIGGGTVVCVSLPRSCAQRATMNAVAA
jgi:two-component system cell cycle sensor histidine kinase PleC